MIAIAIAAAMLSQAQVAPNDAQSASRAADEAERRLMMASLPVRAKIWFAKSKDQAEFNRRVGDFSLHLRFISSCVQWVDHDELRISKALEVKEYPDFLQEFIQWAIDEGQRDPLSHAKCARILAGFRDGTYPFQDGPAKAASKTRSR